MHNNTNAMSLNDAATGERFVVQIIPPKGIVVPGMLSEEIVAINGLETMLRVPETIKQPAVGHERIFKASWIPDSSIPFNLVMNLNFSGKLGNEMEIYNMWMGWANRIYNKTTGATSLKRDYVGTVIIEQHNKAGYVWRRTELSTVIIDEITGLDEAAVESQEPMQLTVNLIAEKFETFPKQ